MSSLWSRSFSSTHVTYSAPAAKAGLSAPSSMYFFHSGVSVTFFRNAPYQSTASLGMFGAAQRQVAHGGAERLLDRGDALPRAYGEPRGVEHRERAHPPGPPMARALGRVVHGRVHVLADQVDAHLAAPLEGHVGELDARESLLELDREDLVFLRRAGAPHQTLAPLALLALLVLDGGEVFLGGLVWRVRVHPQNELIEGHAGQRRVVAPVEREVVVQRRREEIRERDDDGVGVALLVLDVEESLGARGAGLVDDDERTGRELVLVGEAGDQPRHLIGAAAGSSRHHELDRLGRLPRDRGVGDDDQRGEDGQKDAAELHRSLLYPRPGLGARSSDA